MSASPDPTGRFSDRVADYVRYRPGYPDDIIRILRDETGFPTAGTLADVGSGTGISTELFLRHGYATTAVEPNRAMREAAEARLGEHAGFRSVDGTAEATTLGNQSVDAVVAAQAFHWFRPAPTRAEFRRILRPAGPTVLLWNSRQIDTTPFLREYEALLNRFGTDYAEVRHDRVRGDALKAFFTGGFQRRVLPSEQVFEFEGLRGRLLSSSYAPAAGHPDRAPMLRELERIFGEHAREGQVHFRYDTEIYVGRV